MASLLSPADRIRVASRKVVRVVYRRPLDSLDDLASLADPATPPALRDRMEVIQLPGYTAQEKLQIARRYLVARQLAATGLSAEQCSIGDDTLQRKASGTVQPDTFTHGTSAQRVHWFKQGYETGQIEQCDTFKAGAP